MYVSEGTATIKIKKSAKISKEMDVFYNPAMKINRDISILLLNSVDKGNMQIALPLAASGIRGIRFLKELDKNKIKNISFNDYDVKAVRSIKNNLKLNNFKNVTIIKKLNQHNKKNSKNNQNKILVFNEDADLFLLNSKGFDYIDVDPFGSSNNFLDAAIKRIARDGILAITNTDTAALTGTFPKVCARKYWALPKLDYMMHETGVRILIRKVQLVGMQFEKALIPIFSYYKDHYYRIFFKCVKSKVECDKISKKHGMFNGAGPLWVGSLWDEKLTSKMYSLINLLKNKKIKNQNKTINQDNELIKFLKIIKGESKIDAVGFFDIHDAVKRKKLGKIIKKEELIFKIRKKGYKAADTHFSGTGIRTGIEYKKIKS